MNYSVFKLQNQGGKPSIFWEKESVPKNDRKFGYKQRKQRFPVRRYPGDRNEVETDLVALTPDEPAPPPKPAKNFIRRNRDKVVTKKKEVPSTVTLTQEQLNAILKSVGKVAGGSENAVKISIANDNSKEILIESPRRKDRYDDDDDIEDEREKRRSKKRIDPKDEEDSSIFSLLDNKKSKPKANSDNESYISDAESLELVKKSRRRRRDRKSRRENDDDEDESKENRNRRGRVKKVFEYNSDDDELKIRKDHSKPRKHDTPDDEDYYERNKSRRNKSRYRDDENDDDNDYRRDDRRRQARLRKRDDSYDNDDDDNRDNETRERYRKSERTKVSRDRKEKKDQSRERDTLNTSENKDVEEIPSPRDKIGLPNDLSWRHMTKAERRRLEMARQRLIDEEERREGEKMYKIEAEIGLLDKRRQAPRSDPVTRQDKPYGRDTQTTNHTDGFRRDRRSRTPEDNRRRSPDRSPEIPSHHSPEASPKASMGISRRHMTLAEKKRLEWERDRVESKQLGKLDEPWGRPGAGAPLRTRSGHVVANYKGRQDQLHNSVQAIEEESVEEPRDRSTHVEERAPPRDNRYRHEPPTSQPVSNDGPVVPHAMRTSFVLGQGAPDVERFESNKEKERKKWLAELEKQIEEKRLKEMKNTEVKEEDTWANKLGMSHRHVPFPEQPKDTVSATGDVLSTLGDMSTGLDTNRASSAPGDGSDSKSHIRGQNVPIDPLTKKELEDKRQKYLDHQNAIKAQVEEKERLKRQEREKKIKEDMEEERKLQAERDLLKKQFETEQQKIRQKEAQRQAQVNQLKAAMDEAQAKAMQEKYQRKMERLEAGGHDTSKLREHLEGEITSRIEELHTRRERDIQRAQKVLELQHWGLGPLEEHPSEAGAGLRKSEPQGLSKTEHNAKITPRTEDRGYNMHIEPTSVPGLDLSTVRTNIPQLPIQQPHPPDTEHKPSHQPYTGNRVLTPSRFRHPSKPWSDPTSPRREFGTQTGNRTDSAYELDGDDVNQLLNQNLARDDSDVNIEYRIERGRKVRVISAPKEAVDKRRRHSPANQSPKSHGRTSPHSSRDRGSPHQHHHEVLQKKEKEELKRKKRLENQRRHGPVKPGSRPMWGYKNPDHKKPKKQSEKDPFYEQKKRISERRRIERENKLLAMVEKNRDIIPEYYVPAERSARSRDPSPFSDFGGETPREARVARRSKSHSPNRFNSTAHSDVLRIHNESRNHIPARDRSQSPTESRSPGRQQGQVQGQQPRSRSPPIPAIKHRHEAHGGDPRNPGKRGGKYKDADPLDIPVQNGEFVPFTRTIDVLDPARADEPLPISREATRVANARKQYYENLNPEKFGDKQFFFQDRDRVPKGPEDLKNPIFNPGLVTDHPTTRQDQILLQLSTLKQSLMQRQRELETFSPSDLEKQATNLYIE